MSQAKAGRIDVQLTYKTYNDAGEETIAIDVRVNDLSKEAASEQLCEIARAALIPARKQVKSEV